MGFLEFLNTELAPRSDRATGEDFILAVRTLKDVTADAIPNCIYEFDESPDARMIIIKAIAALDDNDPATALAGLLKYESPSPKLNVERLFILIWVMALKEQPDIILEDIARMVDMTNQEGIVRLLKRIWHFWTNLSTDDLDKKTKNAELIAIDDVPDREEGEVNPPGEVSP